MQTAHSIRSLPDRDVQIIFLTSYSQYMLNSFNVQPFQYLIKPVSYERFKTEITKLCDYIQSDIYRYIEIRTNAGGHMLLRAADIIAIVKIDQKHVEIITINQRVVTAATLTHLITQLDASFFQVYRSVIINLTYIHKFTSNMVVMSNQDEYPIGRSQGQGVKTAYARYRMSHFKERG